MKRNFFLTACIFLLSFSTKAQDIHYGLTVGANLSNINGNGVENNYYSGYMAGIYARKKLNEKWEVQPELFFNQVNSKEDPNFINFYNLDGNPNASNQIKLSYVSLPVLFSYKLSKLFTVNAGPQYSILVYDNENLTLSDKANAFKRNDFGVTGGGQLVLGSVRFFADYTLGLANVNNIDNRYKWRNRQIRMGFNFKIM